MTVSIIIPVFNVRPDLLDRALSSAFAQSNSDVEVVVVDDGSASPVGDWLARLCPHHARRSNFSLTALPDNLGIAAARNAGVKEAAGSHLVWLDADDTLEPDCVERLYASSPGKTLIIGECNVWHAGQVQRRRPACYYRKALTCLGTLQDPFLLNVISVQPQIIDREIFLGLGGFDVRYRFAEMTDLFLRYLSRHGLTQVDFIEDAVYNYYRDRHDSVSSARDELTRHRERCLTEYLVRSGHAGARMRYRSRDPETGMQQFMVEN